MSREGIGDLPGGYWERKHWFGLALMEQVVEETKDPRVRIIGLTHHPQRRRVYST
jgi:hypothetical protein